MKKQDRRNPELRRALRVGVIAFGPPWVVLIPAISQTLLMLGLSYPLLFLGRCVFIDIWIAEAQESCQVIPTLPLKEWVVYLVTLFASALVYTLITRSALRRGGQQGAAGFYAGGVTAVAFMLSLVIGERLGRYMTMWGGRSSFALLTVLAIGPIGVLLWRTHLVLWAGAMGRQLLSADQRIAVTANALIRRYLRRSGSVSVEVRHTNGELIVRGPVDAVDSERIKDIVATHFVTPLAVHIETTLDTESYWRSYRDPLAPSGYRSPDISEPPSLPSRLFGSLGVLFLFVIVLALRHGPGFGIGITPEQIASFYAAQGVAVPSAFPPGAPAQGLQISDVPESELFAEPFMIDVEGSADVCPGLAQTHWSTRYRMDAEAFVGPYMDSETTDSTLRHGDVVARIHRGVTRWSVFLISRATGRCLAEIEVGTNASAGRIAHQTPGVLIGEWVSIPRSADWRFVPPIPGE